MSGQRPPPEELVVDFRQKQGCNSAPLIISASSVEKVDSVSLPWCQHHQWPELGAALVKKIKAETVSLQTPEKTMGIPSNTE